MSVDSRYSIDSRYSFRLFTAEAFTLPIQYVTEMQDRNITVVKGLQRKQKTAYKADRNVRQCKLSHQSHFTGV